MIYKSSLIKSLQPHLEDQDEKLNSLCKVLTY